MRKSILLGIACFLGYIGSCVNMAESGHIYSHELGFIFSVLFGALFGFPLGILIVDAGWYYD